MLNERSRRVPADWTESVMTFEFAESESDYDSVLNLFDVYLAIVGRSLEFQLDKIVDQFETYLNEMMNCANFDDEKVVLLIRMLSERCLDFPEFVAPRAFNICNSLGILTFAGLFNRSLDVVREVAYLICIVSRTENFSLAQEHLDLIVRLVLDPVSADDSDIWMTAVTTIHNIAEMVDVAEIISEEDMYGVISSITAKNSTGPEMNVLEANAFVLFDFAVACPGFLTSQLVGIFREMVQSSLEFMNYVRSVLAELLLLCDEVMTDDSGRESPDSFNEFLKSLVE
jgi:hypothetical protein